MPIDTVFDEKVVEEKMKRDATALLARLPVHLAHFTDSELIRLATVLRNELSARMYALEHAVNPTPETKERAAALRSVCRRFAEEEEI